ncbi:DUF342 domain-containing protein [Photobacterium sanctipauli]|uniref:DUF342 domain-containing protein n=1 Tax=Photobacterium sanctipauli TaxID=1342794 RepID=A0A2T3NP52_9GAMM|nr:FapA family protein [Photobacterium sanctipauli]PSW18053.1 DUF342 domain-containing protein [Photobacterium sanctipauli]
MAESFLQLSQDKQSIFLSADRYAGEALTRDMLISQIEKLGAQNYYRFESAIDSALAFINQPTPDDGDVTTDIKPIIVAECRDASYLVKTEADMMKASLTITAPYGGKAISGPALLEALKDNHIVKGIRKNQLQEIIRLSGQLSAGQKITVPVAFGRMPEHGADTRFEALVEDVGSRILRPQALDDGKVDMLDLGELVTVKAGQAIMRRIPATPGTPGFTVEGKELPAVAGKPAEFEVGEGTAISEQDENILLALKSGIPVMKPKGMQVDDALTLKGVNVATGHISFDGSVIINGDVTPGMKVAATGNITVTGFVELAELKAGGDIAIIKGVIGRKQEGSPLACYLEAGGKVTSKFAQFAEIEAGQDVSFSLHALHCVIRTQGEVVVTDQLKRHGTLSGGYIEAGYSVRAVNIGALAGVPTTIIAFGRYHHLLEQLQLAADQYDKEKDSIQQLKQAQLKLIKIPQSKRPPELVEKLKQTAQHHRDSLIATQHNFETLKAEYEELRELVSVTALNRIYSGVKIQLEKEKLTLNQEHGPSKIQIRDREIQCQPL